MADGKTLGLGGGGGAARRERTEIGEIETFEPATEAEWRGTWDCLDAEPRREAERRGMTWLAFRRGLKRARRTIAAYHRGELLGVVSIADLSDGDAYLNFARTAAAVGRGHKVTVAKTIGRFSREFLRSERARGLKGRLLASVPVENIRGTWFYVLCGGWRVIGEFECEGFRYNAMQMKEVENGNGNER